MKTIYKFKIFAETDTVIQMPKDAKVLTFGKQNGELFIWVLTDPDDLPVSRLFRIYGTGHDIWDKDDPVYVGTVQIEIYVWHLFELV